MGRGSVCHTVVAVLCPASLVTCDLPLTCPASHDTRCQGALPNLVTFLHSQMLLHHNDDDLLCLSVYCCSSAVPISKLWAWGEGDRGGLQPSDTPPHGGGVCVERLIGQTNSGHDVRNWSRTLVCSENRFSLLLFMFRPVSTSVAESVTAVARVARIRWYTW